MKLRAAGGGGLGRPERREATTAGGVAATVTRGNIKGFSSIPKERIKCYSSCRGEKKSQLLELPTEDIAKEG